jgi:hypothetical protein
MEMKLQAPKAYLPAILANEQLGLRTRLRAAVFLARFGEKTGVSLLSKVALLATKQELDALADEYDPDLSDAVGYSIEHLPEALGEQAVPVLQGIARKYGYSIMTMQAFSELGEAAIPTLIAMLADQDDVDAQYLAAEAIWAMGARGKAAVPALIKALDVKSKTSRGWRIDGIAVDALGQIGQEAKPAVPALQRLANDEDKELRMRALEALQKINK